MEDGGGGVSPVSCKSFQEMIVVSVKTIILMCGL